jgi:hypothetical protein
MVTVLLLYLFICLESAIGGEHTTGSLLCYRVKTLKIAKVPLKGHSHGENFEINTSIYRLGPN